ncbi:MAG TPA: EamA family transporter [Planctomycetota bacterium]
MKVVLAFASVYLCWGSTYLAMRVAVESMPPFLMAGSRFILAGSLLYAYARRRGAAPPERIHWRSAAIVGALLLVGGNGGVVWAEKTVPSGIAALLVASVPLWIALFQWLGPDRLRPRAWGVVGLGGGFAGVALLALWRDATAGPVNPAGAAALVGASISWAAGTLVARRAPFPASPLLAAALQMLAGGVLQIATGLALGEAGEVGVFTGRSWIAWGYLVVFGSLCGYVPYVWLLGVRPAAQVATYAYVNPAIAVVLGWAILGEPLTGRMLAAAALIVASVAAITVSAGRSAPAAPETRR